MPYPSYNSSLPTPITFSTLGAFAPDAAYVINTTGQIVDVDVQPFSTAVVTITGQFFSSSSTPFDIGIFVSADGETFLSRPVFSLLNQRAFPAVIDAPSGLVITPDIYYIPVLGCRVLRFVSAPDFSGSVTLGVHLTSGPATTDIPGSVVPKTNGSLPIGNTLTNVPVFPSDINNAQICQLVYPTIFNGSASSFNWERPRTPNKYTSINRISISGETAIWSPPTATFFSPGQIWRLMGYHLTSSVGGNILFRDGTGGSIIYVVPSAANGAGTYCDLREGIASEFGTIDPLFGGPVDNIMTVQGPHGSFLSGTIWGQWGLIGDVGPTVLGGGFF